MNQSNPSWSDMLRRLLYHANLVLQQGNRAAAAEDMAQAAELLFLQAKKEGNLEEKKRLVNRGTELLERSVRLVDDSQVAPTQSAALSNVERATPDAPVATAQKPKSKTLTFSDIAGLETVKETLMQRVVYPLRFPEKLERYGITGGGGMLLYGPPGTGKTLLVRAVAGELELPFFVIKSSEVLSQYYGQSEKQLAELFGEARSQPNGAVVFLDEIDALGAKRTESMNEASRRVLNQLLQELDGVDGRSGKLVFFAATNEPWLLDAALLRPPRFSEKCYVPLPDADARKVLFEMGLRNCPVDSDVIPERLAALSEGLSGADIANICERAKLIPFTESIRTGQDRPLSQQDFDEAMKNVQPSVTAENMKRYETVFGKQPKVLAADKKVASLEDNDIDVFAIINSLKKFGFNEKEAKQKINAAVQAGFKAEEEIVKYIFSQR